MNGLRSGLIVFAVLVAAPALAQQPSVETSRLWLVAGAASTTKTGHCRNCPDAGPYSTSGSLLVNVGGRVNDRMDAGLELAVMPGEADSGDRNRVSMYLGVVQFTPWASRGFFLKGGIGMGFVRNWVYSDGATATDPYTSKALSVAYGAGWAFRTNRRLGLQVYGAHHAIALGDLPTSTLTAENIMGNLWSIGAAIVVR
jgi:hypothetical protein